MGYKEFFTQSLLIVYLRVLGIFSPVKANQAKRMILVTSLAYKLSNEGVIRKNSLEKINRLMYLYKDTETTELSKELKDVIWNGRKSLNNLKEHKRGWLTDTEATNHAKQITSEVPYWLSYDKDKMVKDVYNMLLIEPVNATQTTNV